MPLNFMFCYLEQKIINFQKCVQTVIGAILYLHLCVYLSVPGDRVGGF